MKASQFYRLIVLDEAKILLPWLLLGMFLQKRDAPTSDDKSSDNKTLKSTEKPQNTVIGVQNILLFFQIFMTILLGVVVYKQTNFLNKISTKQALAGIDWSLVEYSHANLFIKSKEKEDDDKKAVLVKLLEIEIKSLNNLYNSFEPKGIKEEPKVITTDNEKHILGIKSLRFIKFPNLINQPSLKDDSQVLAIQELLDIYKSSQPEWQWQEKSKDNNKVKINTDAKESIEGNITKINDIIFWSKFKIDILFNEDKCNLQTAIKIRDHLREKTGATVETESRPQSRPYFKQQTMADKKQIKAGTNRILYHTKPINEEEAAYKLQELLKDKIKIEPKVGNLGDEGNIMSGNKSIITIALSQCDSQ